jgi:hypothetical protein
MKKLLGITVFCIALFLGVVGYTSFTQTGSAFDATYWKERYDQSQWMLLGSTRTIGDDGLYAYVGDAMMHGRDPTTINAEMPPFGKYLIGLSILLTGSWWAAAYGTYIIILGVFFALAWIYLGSIPKEKRFLFSLLGTGLVATDPLLLKQAYMSMLDATLLVFLLLHTYLTKRYADKRHRRWIVLAGITLGLFASIKFPAFAPVVALSMTVPILLHGHIIEDALLYGASALTAYLGTYIVYFFSGHSLLDWLKVQKWIINFYASSHLPRYPESVYGYLLTGRYRDLFTGAWSLAPERTVVWVACIVMIGVVIILRWKSIFTFVRSNVSTIIVAIGILGMCTIVPFWPRYTLLLLPFLYLGGILGASQIPVRFGARLVVTFGLIIMNIVASSSILLPSIDSRIGEITYEWNHQFFGDLVRHTNTRPSAYEGWIRMMNHVSTVSHIESIRIAVDPISTPLFASDIMVPATVTYLLKDCGTYTHRTEFHMVRTTGGWKLSWDWSYVYPSLTDSSSVLYSSTPMRRGTLRAVDGKILAEDAAGMMISLIPKNIDPTTEEKLYRRLSELIGGSVSFDAIQARVRTTTRYSEPIAIGSLSISEDIQHELLTNYAGGAVVLTPTTVRRIYGGDGYVGKTEHPLDDAFGKLLYSPATDRGVSGLEKTYDGTLAATGTCGLSVHDATGRITLIKQWDGANGQDVTGE